MQWSASLSLLSVNKAFSIIIHSVFVKLDNVSYGQDFTLEAILFWMLELDSHRYGAGVSLWPKNWTHEQQLSQKNNFSPNWDFFPFLESYLLDQDILYWQQKNYKFSHQLSSEVTSCHHLSIIIITSYQVLSSIMHWPTNSIKYYRARLCTRCHKIPMMPWKTQRSSIKILFRMFKSQLQLHQ